MAVSRSMGRDETGPNEAESGSAPAASVAVVGAGETGRRAVDRFSAFPGDDGRPNVVVAEEASGSSLADAGAVLVAADPGEVAADELDGVGESGPVVAVVAGDNDELDRIRAAADAVLLLPGTGATGLRDGLRRLTRLLGARSVVNLDVADLATVLRGGDLATFAHGRGDEREAVERAFAGVPADVRPESGRTALVHVLVGPTTSVEAVGSVVDAVRERVERDAHLIWGTTVEAARSDVGLEVVVGGVGRAPVPGDPCPRCGSPLVGYSLGDRSTVACDACGFAGSAARLR